MDGEIAQPLLTRTVSSSNKQTNADKINQHYLSISHSDVGEYREEPNDDEQGDLDDENTPLSRIPHLWLIEAALYTNVFLSGFDSTVTASTYQTIGNEFNHMDLSSWITASYLITSTSFQPLYGSFSDVLGRRKCLFFASMIFSIGCLGCGISINILWLSFMRAFTGIGGGGLITLSTIVNSDMIPTSKRGIFQAFQNLLLGLGAICGASFGGVITSSIGWRWCFLLQVPISLAGALIGHLYVRNQDEYERRKSKESSQTKEMLKHIDFSGAFLIIIGLTLQLVYLSLGSAADESGNTWSSPGLSAVLVASFIVLVLFVLTEERTSARAIIPSKLVRSLFSFLVLTISVLVGFASYAYLFTLPLFFQVILGDSTAKAGLRLAIPSVFTPVGGLIAGICMSKFNCLQTLLYVGIAFMCLGNFLFLYIGADATDSLIGFFLIPANLGQGITFPSSLFTFIFAFSKIDQATATSTLYLFRSIGSVWGVTGSAGIVQFCFSHHLEKALEGLLDERKIRKLIKKITSNTSYIKELEGPVKVAVIESFDTATKKVHLISTSFCLVALILCVIKDVFKPKTTKS
ncbi:hypothetical protein ZYGR_0A00180 [Zygosaccharomyces rouxii]|uniref:Major facilitator superfamily (MFS) profile domain-containing protein n=1 Tax=Zygosaccharomyces rouxii TaxID=4956 RepID=A0A1Q2ZSI1_ZYGRO|nr:hypothetical protein ZYGR_0A00180 [Zygosaccharomyces rouxii]